MRILFNAHLFQGSNMPLLFDSYIFSSSKLLLEQLIVFLQTLGHSTLPLNLLNDSAQVLKLHCIARETTGLELNRALDNLQ